MIRFFYTLLGGSLLLVILKLWRSLSKKTPSQPNCLQKECVELYKILFGTLNEGDVITKTLYEMP